MNVMTFTSIVADAKLSLKDWDGFKDGSVGHLTMVSGQSVLPEDRG